MRPDRFGQARDRRFIVAVGLLVIIAGEFPRELFRKHGIIYEISKTPKSDLFHDLLPLFNSGRITLPRNDRLVAHVFGSACSVRCLSRS